MCGAISLTVRSEPAAFYACACDMRRHLTGSQFKSPMTETGLATQIGSDGA